MKKNFPPKPLGMSQLDYLWLNFGGLQITNEVSKEPSENTVLSEKAVTELFKSILIPTPSGIVDLNYEKDPNNPGMVRIIGKAVDGSILTVIRMPEEVRVLSFVGRKVTLEDIDNGFDYPIGSLVLSITLSNGEEYLVSLDELNLVINGGQTDTVYTEVINGTVKSNIKLDKGNNELSVVKLKKSNSGLYANLVVSENNSVKLDNVNGSLKAYIPIGTTGYELKVDTMTLAEYLNIPFKDPGTLYFITDVPYIFLGNRRYGINIDSGDAPIVSLQYDPDTLILTYKRSDESDPRQLSLGPVNEILNGIMTKEQYIELLKLKTALDGIINIKLYISEQISTVGITLEWGEVKGDTKTLLLKNGFGDTISSVNVEVENYLDFALNKRAEFDDVIEAAKSGILISEGEQILILTLTSGDKIYVSVKDLVDTYIPTNSKSINLTISSSNEIKADLNISEEDKMLYIYKDGLASHLQIIREPGKVIFYGKTITEEDKLGEFNIPDAKLKSIFIKEITEEIASEYPPRLINGEEYDRLSNPIKIGESYLIECFGNENDFRYNDYTCFS